MIKTLLIWLSVIILYALALFICHPIVVSLSRIFEDFITAYVFIGVCIGAFFLCGFLYYIELNTRSGRWSHSVK
jgi:predicted MFS family arabinose efflux permease